MFRSGGMPNTAASATGSPWAIAAASSSVSVSRSPNSAGRCSGVSVAVS